MKFGPFRLMPLLLCGSISLATFAGDIPPGAKPRAVPEWSTQSLLYDIPCHDQIPDYHFTFSSAFSRENALLLLISAWLGHAKDPELIKEQLAAWGFQHVWLLGRDAKGVKGYIAEHRDFILLAFRGTESKGDNLADSFFATSPAEDIGIQGRIHLGLYLRFKSIYRRMDRILDHRPRPRKPLIVIGHSLGGATALVAALHRLSVGDKLMALYTFAQLRVGDDTFGDFADEQLAGRYFRIYHAYDMTPQVPPSRAAAREFGNLITARLPEARELVTQFAWYLGYGHHAGAAYSFTGGASLPTLERRGELQIEIDYWKALQQQLGGLTSLDDLNAAYQQRFGNHPPYYYICNMF